MSDELPDVVYVWKDPPYMACCEAGSLERWSDTTEPDAEPRYSQRVIDAKDARM